MAGAAAVMDALVNRASLAAVCHDNPDPDCLASALALERMARLAGVDRTAIVYGGELSHQQNRALVDHLQIELTHVATTTLDRFEVIGFVDHSNPRRSADLDDSLQPDIVVDHHPDTAVDAPVSDVRPEYGATASLFTEYFDELDLQFGERLATALLFALHRERLDFVRGPTASEYRGALAVIPEANVPLIRRLYASAFSSETVDAIGQAITSREHRGSALVASAGDTAEPDALPQAADYLLNVNGVETTLVYGIVEGRIRMSARSVSPDVHVGTLLRDAFGEYGSFGGHHDMGAGWIDLGLYGTGTDEDRLLSIVEEGIADRFFDTLEQSRSYRG